MKFYSSGSKECLVDFDDLSSSAEHAGVPWESRGQVQWHGCHCRRHWGHQGTNQTAAQIQGWGWPPHGEGGGPEQVITLH